MKPEPEALFEALCRRLIRARGVRAIHRGALLRVFLELCIDSPTPNETRMGIRRLSKVVGASPKTTSAAIAKGEQAGLLSVVRQPGAAVVIRIRGAG